MKFKHITMRAHTDLRVDMDKLILFSNKRNRQRSHIYRKKSVRVGQKDNMVGCPSNTFIIRYFLSVVSYSRLLGS